MQQNNGGGLPPDDTIDEDRFGAHSGESNRFTAEPAAKRNKAVVIVITIFVVVMAVLGVGVVIAKQKIGDYFAKRSEVAEKDKAEKKAAEGINRKEKTFQTVALNPGDAALPSTFGQVSPLPIEGDQQNANPIPIIRNAGSTPQPMPRNAQLGQVRPPAPAMMLGDNSGGNSGGNEQFAANARAGQAPYAGMSPTPPDYSAQALQMTTALRDGGGGAASAGAVGGPGAVAGPGAGGRPATVQELAGQAAVKNPVTSTAQASAANLGNRNYLLARGSFIPCVLETQLISNIAGQSSCVMPQDIFSDNGKVLLLEKGSRVIGVYTSSVKSGDSRIAILWQRIKTPTGVVIDVDSGAADGLGTMGAPGYVNNHWPERIGAAFLLSVVEDAVKIAIAKESGGNASQTPQATAGATTTLSEKVLESTINITPTLYKNRGDRLMVYVNRDLWFDTVYSLKQR